MLTATPTVRNCSSSRYFAASASSVPSSSPCLSPASLSGYGYRLGRILITYALIVTVSTAGFFFTGHVLSSPTLTGQSLVQGVLDAFQISLNSIHGRVFFAQFGLDTAQSWLATAESIIGIVIEGVFVAMLIQRFFGR